VERSSRALLTRLPFACALSSSFKTPAPGPARRRPSSGGRHDRLRRAPRSGFVTRYQYARYDTNAAVTSATCTAVLDRLGIAGRPNGPWRISVDRRQAAALDRHVGHEQ